MIQTQEVHVDESLIVGKRTRPLEQEQGKQGRAIQWNTVRRKRLFSQLLRFGLVGGLNTFVDLLILNGLLWLFPAKSTSMLLALSALAYGTGALNSYLLNKYWTFRHKLKATPGELTRFALTTLGGMVWSTLILWLASDALRPLLGNTTLWANTSKVVAIGGTALISYVGMRLWVFVGSRAER